MKYKGVFLALVLLPAIAFGHVAPKIQTEAPQNPEGISEIRITWDPLIIEPLKYVLFINGELLQVPPYIKRIDLHLKPGTYNFMIKSVNKSGAGSVWSEEVIHVVE